VSEKNKIYVVGIDPDCDKSGLAIKDIATKTFDLHDLTFWELYEFLYNKKEIIKKVRVEASWLIKFNWHAKRKGTAALNANIGSRTGANHQTGKLIVEMCKYLNIDVEEVRPLRKVWKTKSGKISKKEFVALTGWKGTASQEVRDAYLFVHYRCKNGKTIYR